MASFIFLTLLYLHTSSGLLLLVLTHSLPYMELASVYLEWNDFIRERCHPQMERGTARYRLDWGILLFIFVYGLGWRRWEPGIDTIGFFLAWKGLLQEWTGYLNF